MGAEGIARPAPCKAKPALAPSPQPGGLEHPGSAPPGQMLPDERRPRSGNLPSRHGRAPGAPAWLLPAGRPRAPQCRLCSPSWVKKRGFCELGPAAARHRSPGAFLPAALRRQKCGPAVASCRRNLILLIYFCCQPRARAGERRCGAAGCAWGAVGTPWDPPPSSPARLRQKQPLPSTKMPGFSFGWPP